MHVRKVSGLVSLVGFLLLPMGCGDDDGANPASDAGETDGGTVDLSDSGEMGAPSALELCARASACLENSASFAFACRMISILGSSTGEGTDERIFRAQLDCVAAAENCEGVRRCTMATAEELEACDDESDSVCVGNVLIACGGGKDGKKTGERVDCGAAGLSCVEGDGTAGCGLSACDSKATQETCDGALQVRCSDGVLGTHDCRSSFSYSCSSGGEDSNCQTHVGDLCVIAAGEGEAECQGTGEECDEDAFVNSCEGSQMITCANGRVGERDCAQVRPGFTCKIGSDGAASCAFPENECEMSGVETCEGGVITFCDFGRSVEVDCTEYGYGDCVEVADDESSFVRCVE